MNLIDTRAAQTTRPLRSLAASLVLVLASATLATDSRAVEDEEVFRLLGVEMGRSLTDFQLEEDELAIVIESLRDVVADNSLVSPSEDGMKRVMEVRNERVAKANLEFVEKVANEPGAKVQDSGLIYFELEAGSGQSPESTDTVEVHYEGTLTNGAVFDSSIQRGTPAEFPLNRVIACWTEGVGMMKIGGKARLVCPPGIAYGDRGAPPKIPGGAVISFNVELLSIKGPDAAATE